jgi:hypothetical protein
VYRPSTMVYERTDIAASRPDLVTRLTIREYL